MYMYRTLPHIVVCVSSPVGLVGHIGVCLHLSMSSWMTCLSQVGWVILGYDYHMLIFNIIVYWTLTSNTNIRAFVKTNALNIFPYQSCLSRAKSISVVFITWEIHISRVHHVNNIAGLYDKFLIIRFERNTMETSLVHCLRTRKQYRQWTRDISWYCAQNGQ